MVSLQRKRVVHNGKNWLLVFLTMVVVMLMSFSCILTVSAAGSGGTGTSDANNQLYTSVSEGVKDKSYQLSGGGTIKGSSLLTSSGKINEGNFAKLTSAAQSDFVSDVATYSQQAADNETCNGQTTKLVTDETVQNWWKQLQSSKGVGSKFMNVILENTKPDFVTANQIYQPFSGIVGTVMGIIAVLGMALLGISLTADIFYIALPPVRIFVADSESGDGKGKKVSSKLFSNDAVYAVKVAEEADSSDGNKKQALGIYLKRRIFMLILLGICLLYLVQGQIYTLVGWVLDLVSGFLGF